jgi:hypothetical protein
MYICMCIIRYVFEEIAIAAWLLALWNKEAAAAAAQEEEEQGEGGEEEEQEEREREQEQEEGQEGKLEDQAAGASGGALAGKEPQQQRRRHRPVRFVDLGCGNGFLTYLLIEEGHVGWGIDRQRRGIWGDYPPAVGRSLLCAEVGGNVLLL